MKSINQLAKEVTEKVSPHGEFWVKDSIQGYIIDLASMLSNIRQTSLNNTDVKSRLLEVSNKTEIHINIINQLYGI